MKWNIVTIPNSKQRYPTVGDYFDEKDTTNVFISDMKNEDYEFLVALHEMIECYLTKKRGISEQDITEFDMQFEREREEGLHELEDEPGFAVDAPYLKEHAFATLIERQVADELGIDWEDYERTISNL